MSITSWVVWAFILIAQNFAFTFVSRARNSGSLKRHLIAGFFSNGIWFTSQLLIFTEMFSMMAGKKGIWAAAFAGAYYTVFTLSGSLAAHFYALKTEKGKSAVGASSRYAQITPEQWNKVEQELTRLASAHQWAMES